MKESPIVSVVIPCYNHGRYLEETLQSVVENTNKYLVEIIIVNDGSTDQQTLEVLNKAGANGFFILNQNNQGLAKARNNGIRLAKGKYILPLDSDNNVTYHYLNTTIDILEKEHKIDVIYGNAEYIGERIGIWENYNIDKKKMLYANHIDACAIFRKSVWEKVGGYSEDMPFMGWEDWNFWLKCIEQNITFYFLKEICFEYRVLSDSMIRSTTNDHMDKIFVYNVSSFPTLYQKELKQYHELIQSVFYGGSVRKIVKLFLHHFKLYKY